MDRCVETCNKLTFIDRCTLQKYVNFKATRNEFSLYHDTGVLRFFLFCAYTCE